MGDRRVGHEGSGHLEMDESGKIDIGATELDSKHLESAPEILTGPAGPTWGERLEAVGVTPFLHRHRVLAFVTAVALAVMVVGGAGAVHLRSLPPADDGVVAVTVADSPSATGDETGSGPVVLFSYNFYPVRHGDSLHLLGLDGPGVKESSGPLTAAAVGSVAQFLTVYPRCEDPALVTAKQTDYHLRVERTDALGRRVTGLVGLPPTSSMRWAVALGSHCVQQWFDEHVTTEAVEVAAIATPRGGPEVTLDLHMHNALPADILAAYGGYAFGGLRPGVPNSGTLAASATTVLRVSFPVPDCLTPKDTAAGIADTVGVALSAVVEHPDEPQSQHGWTANGRIKVALSADERRAVNAAVSSMCAGTPPVSVDVVSAVTTTDQPLSRPYIQNGQTVVILKVRLQVVSTAASVTVSDTLSPTQIAQGTPPTITTATSTLRHGTVTPAIDLAVTCDPPIGPPMVQLMLRTSTGTYPRQVELADPTLATAYLRACPNLSATDLRSQGWPKTR